MSHGTNEDFFWFVVEYATVLVPRLQEDQTCEGLCD